MTEEQALLLLEDIADLSEQLHLLSDQLNSVYSLQFLMSCIGLTVALSYMAWRVLKWFF